MANDTIADAALRPKEHRENRKKNRGRKVGDEQASATAKFISCPPRKARLVIDAVRGKYAIDALAFLRFIPNRAAVYISKVLASAVANAANNHGLNPNNLRLVEARVDEGPRMKRVQPRAQGRAYRILKRMCHIMVIVEEVEPKPVKPRKPKTTPSRAAAARAARQPVGEPTVVVTSPVPMESGVEEAEPTNTAVINVTAPEEATSAPAPSATIADTNMTAASAAAEAAAEAPPAATTETAETAPLGEQVADTADTTDEIGAPIEANEAGKDAPQA